MNRFKGPGSTRAGFHYQDLFGLSILIDFYQDRNLYEWVKLESDGDNDGVDPGFLDDIVALRKADGRAEVVQIKFCVDPEREDLALSADWLTRKKAKGTSLIGKWAASAKDLADRGLLGTACLLTNRRPDSVMADALKEGFIRLDSLPADTRTSFVAEAGGEDTAKWFFGIFQVNHSQSEPEDLELTLMYRLVPGETDERGWLLLLRTAMDWASRKDSPREGGRIFHEDLHRILSLKRPRPLSQNFHVPTDYSPPDDHFHNRLLDRLRTPSTTALFGAPGRGKSTYVSYLTERLRKDERPVIRHHYFLSLGDTGPDRVGYATVRTSLLTQLHDQFSDLPDGDTATLRDVLEAAGRQCDEAPLVVIIDGLDHVRRERDQPGADQMNHLFSELLPLPPNVALLLGTQKIAAAHLPSRLDQFSESGDWWELPPLSEAGVLAYLTGQANAGRLPGMDDRQDGNGDWQLERLAKAFHEIGGGHPLHLIYSVEELIRRGQPIVERDVHAMPQCPDGDIRTYYSALWRTLPQAGKDLLHLMATTDFLWPPSGLVDCLGGKVEYLEAEGQIRHMLDQRDSGVAPFHGSILAFIREMEGHEVAAQRLLPQAVVWLRGSAPAFWRDSWLWLTQARQGDPAPLLDGPDRAWVIRLLCLGHPVDQIAETIAAAEHAALDAGAWARLVTLRNVEIRLRNGPEYQASLWFDDFEEAVLRNLEDMTPLHIRADNLSQFSNRRLLSLARVGRGVRPDLPDAAFTAASRRFNALRLFQHSGPELHDEGTALLQLAAHANQYSQSHIIRFAKQFRGGAFAAFVDELVRLRKLDRLLDLMADPASSPAWRDEIANGCVRLACIEGIRLDRRAPNSPVLHHPLARVWRALVDGTMEDLAAAPLPVAEHGPDYDENNRKQATFVHSWFFAAVATALRADGEHSLRPSPFPENQNSAWLGKAMAWLDQCAKDVAGRMQTGMPVDIAVFCPHLPELPLENRTSLMQSEFSGILQRISTDVHLISMAAGKIGPVTAPQIDAVCFARPWSAHGWIVHLVRTDPALLSEDAAKRLLELGDQAQGAIVNELAERGDNYTAQASIAAAHGLDDRTRLCLEKAASCMIGYGYRKDPAVYDVMDAVGACHETGCDTSAAWAAALARPILAIVDYTDGKGTTHARKAFANLLGAVAPHRLPALYQHTIETEDWSLADEVLTVVIQRADLAQTEVQAVIRTTTDRRHFVALGERAKAGCIDAAELLRERRALLGHSTDEVDRSQRPEDKRLEAAPEEAAPDPSAYPPGQVEAYASKLGYRRGQAHMRAWLDYWEGVGQGAQAIENITRFYGAEGRPDLCGALDAAFDRAIDLLGRTEAFDILVLAHIKNSGWSSILSREEDVLARLEKAANHYSDRWQDYVRRVARPLFGGTYEGSVVIGRDMFVRFLVMVGENDLAAEVTDAIVSDYLADLADLPIGSALWTEEKADAS